jgi:hypothetical protein
MVAMGTAGPAVIGTVPNGVTVGVCTTVPLTVVVCPRGSKARSAGVFGPLWPPTFSGVQICPGDPGLLLRNTPKGRPARGFNLPHADAPQKLP